MRLDTYDGEPVYARPAVGDLSPDVPCSCGVSFRGRVDALQWYPDEPVEFAFVTHKGGCGSTRIFYVELPRPMSRAQVDAWAKHMLRDELDPERERAERLADEYDDAVVSGELDEEHQADAELLDLELEAS